MNSIEMAQLSAKENNRISELFANKTILITGGTGFLGKVLIEKLLRLCPEVKKIYILIRPKTTKSGFERLKDTFNDPVSKKV
jgi:fatty acyl-CoA reductase